MAKPDHVPSRAIDENAALRTVLEGTATETEERFFTALVENLTKALNTHGAWITEFDGGADDYEPSLCERVVESTGIIHYPDDHDLEETGAVSFMGTPLLGVDGKVLGHLTVLDQRPMPENHRALAVIRIFAARAAAELRRLRAESEVREREEKLGRLVDSAMDAIMEPDRDLRVTRMNRAGEKVFKCSGAEVLGKDFARFLSDGGREKLTRLIKTGEIPSLESPVVLRPYALAAKKFLPKRRCPDRRPGWFPILRWRKGDVFENIETVFGCGNFTRANSMPRSSWTEN